MSDAYRHNGHNWERKFMDDCKTHSYFWVCAICGLRVKGNPTVYYVQTCDYMIIKNTLDE